MKQPPILERAASAPTEQMRALADALTALESMGQSIQAVAQNLFIALIPEQRLEELDAPAAAKAAPATAAPATAAPAPAAPAVAAPAVAAPAVAADPVAQLLADARAKLTTPEQRDALRAELAHMGLARISEAQGEQIARLVQWLAAQ